ncbi:MAG: hypothetical protein MOGMAGMI_00771 [Candidatus Omnitrophica bacterium]|nr:hypothetical protein [Candidatus Omnitrophota bacterium]
MKRQTRKSAPKKLRTPTKPSRKPIRKIARRPAVKKTRNPLISSKIDLVHDPATEPHPAPAQEAGPSVSYEYQLPNRYHENRAVLLVRDPWWIFAYWEVTPERESEVCEAIRREGLTRDKSVLRIYDITGRDMGSPNGHFDIELHSFVDNWCVDVGVPDREWVCEVGIRTWEGRFFALVRSNAVRTPRFGISDVIDEEWMLPEEIALRLYGYSAGLSGRGGSEEVRDLVERSLKTFLSAGASSRSETPSPERGDRPPAEVR